MVGMVLPMKQLYYEAIIHFAKGFTYKQECFSADSLGV